MYEFLSAVNEISPPVNGNTRVCVWCAAFHRCGWMKLVLVACCLLGVLGMYSFQKYRQLQLVLTRTQDRLSFIERTFGQERDARSSAEARLRVCLTDGSIHDSSPSAASKHIRRTPPTANSESGATSLAHIRDVARTEMREALLRASHAAAGALGTPTSATAVVDASAPALSEAAEATLEAARFSLREALAAEAPGWCSCPPPPNITLLCSALAPPVVSACEHRVSSARAEIELLRSALLEANARANEANDRAIEAAFSSSSLA